jgi:putative effector of murein hydrolase
MIFLLIAVFIGLILYEAPELIRNKYWRELTVFSFLISLAFVVSFAHVLKIEIPNPARDTQYFVKNLLHLSYD